MIHHAVLHVIDDLLVAESARFRRDTQIARVDEANKFRRFVIQENAGVDRVRRGLKEDWILRLHVRFALRQTGRRITAMTIGAAEDDVRRRVHVFAPLVTLEATRAFLVRFRRGLINPVTNFLRGGLGGFVRNGNGWARSGLLRRRCIGREKK